MGGLEEQAVSVNKLLIASQTKAFRIKMVRRL
jgi:hypothetical protein